MSAICGPATEVVHEKQVGILWCFICRGRVAFVDQLIATVEPSYYEPVWHRKCEKGHPDGDLFPGYSRWV